MTLAFEELCIDVDGRQASVLVVTPAVRVVAGRERLAPASGEVATLGELSALDHTVLAEVRRRAERITGFVFRGRHPDGEGGWLYADDLEHDERVEIAYRMFHAHIRLNRVMVHLGVTAHLYIDWDDRELDAFAAATERLIEAVRAAGPLRPNPDTPAAALRRLDLWICSNFTFYANLPLEVASRTVLPMQLRRMYAQRDRLAQLCEGVAAEVFAL